MALGEVAQSEPRLIRKLFCSSGERVRADRLNAPGLLDGLHEYDCGDPVATPGPARRALRARFVTTSYE